MTNCDRQLAEASEGTNLPYNMSWAEKQLLELWMKYNSLPDAGEDAGFCQMPVPSNVNINDILNYMPR